MDIAPRPPARGMVLTVGNYLGTLAAARDLGRNGIPVLLADSDPSSLTSESRFVTRRIDCGSVVDDGRWLASMKAFGYREPGHVLCSTSDDVCCLIDRHAGELARNFYLYHGRPGAMTRLLDKRTLYERCAALGIDQPLQWTPDEALRAASTLPFPLMLKPRSQAGLAPNAKGTIVNDADALHRTLRNASRMFHANGGTALPGNADVLVQQYHPEASHSIYSLAGFYAPERDVFLLRASQKVLQQPLRVGVGLCFEGRPVNQQLARQLRTLMDDVGYCGPFEVEFVALSSGRHLLIDFNPRFYGQMSFEIARGLPIPRLCYFAAIGDWAAVASLAGQAQRDESAEAWHFRNAWLLKFFVTTHWLAGNLTQQNRRFWLEWSRQEPSTDPVQAPDDPGPARALRRQIRHSFMRRPRSTLRRFFRA